MNQPGEQVRHGHADTIATFPGTTIGGPHLRLFMLRHALAVIVLPPLGLAAAIVLSALTEFSRTDFVVLVAMYLLTAIGISVGYHRLFTHRSFKTGTPFRVVLAILGSMAGQGPLIYWVATHRRHHQNSDEHGDPHSPNLNGMRFKERLQGLWHAHIGWMITSPLTNTRHFAKDLQEDPALKFINQTYLVWVVLGLFVPAVLASFATQSPLALVRAFLWGGLARIALVDHFIWSVNSVCHIVGQRPTPTEDRSVNNAWLSLLTFGESWHNNHHAAPSAAIFGWYWWQIDLGGCFIRALSLLGLVWEVKRAPISGR